MAAPAALPNSPTVSSSFRDAAPKFKVELDTDKAQTMGIPVLAVHNALETFLGGLYNNDLNSFRTHLAGADAG